MGKTRDLFKKIRDTKGTFHAKMFSIKDRNCVDLTEADDIKKQRHYFANKVCIVKAMVFLVVMYGSESWTIIKAEHQRIDAFELCCWRRLLRVLWTARRSNQSIKGN